MISIITAIHNQISMNKIFFDYLKKYTTLDHELIIIDNNSSDGSAEYFESKGVKLIRNKHNYSYPYCQNQGINAAKYDNFLFLNNDIIVSPEWDKRILEIVNEHNLEVCSISTNDRLETDNMTHKQRNKWKRAKNPLLFLFGDKKWNLLLMHKLMYGNWEKFTEKVFKNYGNAVFNGICGPAVFITRSGIEKIGIWDERMQSADFDVYLRTKKREKEFKDIVAPKVISGVYFHHYSRLTYKKTNKADRINFKDGENLISIQEKWGKEEAEELLKGSLMSL